MSIFKLNWECNQWGVGTYRKQLPVEETNANMTDDQLDATAFLLSSYDVRANVSLSVS